MVITEILSDKGLLPEISRDIDFFLIPYSDSERSMAIKTVQTLRKKGFIADILLATKKLKGALREAARLDSGKVILFLPKEIEEGLIVLRDLHSGEESRVSKEEFLNDPGSFI